MAKEIRMITVSNLVLVCDIEVEAGDLKAVQQAVIALLRDFNSALAYLDESPQLSTSGPDEWPQVEDIVIGRVVGE